MEEIKNCRTLEDVRREIDTLDRRLLEILSVRKEYVRQAGYFKKDRLAVAAPDRVRAMQMVRLQSARQLDLDLYFCRDLFKLITGYFIEREQAQWEKDNGEIDMDAPVIRPLEDRDTEALYRLQLDAYLGEGFAVGELDIPPLTESLDEFRQQLAGCRVLVAEYGKRPVGMVKVSVSAGTAYIGRLVVHPLYQGLGLGGRLLAEGEKAAGDVERYELFTGRNSAANVRFYNNRGYVAFPKAEADELLVFMEKQC